MRKCAMRNARRTPERLVVVLHLLRSPHVRVHHSPDVTLVTGTEKTLHRDVTGINRNFVALTRQKSTPSSPAVFTSPNASNYPAVAAYNLTYLTYLTYVTTNRDRMGRLFDLPHTLPS